MEYVGIDGTTYRESETSEHHVFARSLAKGRRAKKLINRFGLIPRLANKYHHPGPPQALHTNVQLLRPPDGDALDILTNFMISYKESNPYDRLIGITEYIGDMAVFSNHKEVRKEFGRIEENLTQQLPYVLIGQVVLLN